MNKAKGRSLLHALLAATLLFMLLAITPFFNNGGAIDFGFPFFRIFKFDVPPLPQYCLQALLGLMPIFVVNLLVICLPVIIFLRRRDNLKWAAHFEWSLACNLFLVWLSILINFILLVHVKYFPEHLLIPRFVDWFGFYLYLPNILFGKSWGTPSLFLGILSRAWFVITTFILTGVLYLISKLMNKYFAEKINKLNRATAVLITAGVMWLLAVLVLAYHLHIHQIVIRD